MLSVFEEIDAVVSLYQRNKATSQQLPKRSDRRSELTKLSKALAVILEKGPAATLVFSWLDEYAGLLASAETLKGQLDVILQEPSARGPEPDGRRWVVERLVDLFEKISGEQPSIYWTDHSGGFEGKVYDFCWVALPDLKELSLGQLIRELLTRRRKEEKS